MNKRIVFLPIALAILASCNVSEPRESSIEEQEKATLDEKSLAVEIASDYRHMSVHWTKRQMRISSIPKRCLL